MSDNSQLEKKWKEACTNDTTEKLCSGSHIKPGCFLVVASRNLEICGDGPIIRVFEDIRDAVAFYKYVEVPRTRMSISISPLISLTCCQGGLCVDFLIELKKSPALY